MVHDEHTPLATTNCHYGENGKETTNHHMTPYEKWQKNMVVVATPHYTTIDAPA